MKTRTLNLKIRGRRRTTGTAATLRAVRAEIAHAADLERGLGETFASRERDAAAASHLACAGGMEFAVKVIDEHIERERAS